MFDQDDTRKLRDLPISFGGFSGDARMWRAATNRLMKVEVLRKHETVHRVTAVATAALACELGLKALLAHENPLWLCLGDLFKALPKEASGHGLAALFELLSPTSRSELRASVEKRCTGAEEMVMKVPGLEHMEEATKFAQQRRTFDENLAMASTAFERFRYTSQSETLAAPLGFLRVFAEVLELEIARAGGTKAR